jgi:hypothetical protein
MIPLLDCSGGKIVEIASGLNAEKYGQLHTPLTNYARIPGLIYGVDNGGFTTQDIGAFRRLVKRLGPYKADCKFLVMPDVPGDGRRTLELFRLFKDEFAGWPLAITIQNGIENLDIPWVDVAAVFMAGLGDWKMGAGAVGIIKAAKWLEKWVHVGRISDARRWKFFEELGCDSADSSVLVRPMPGRTEGLSRYLKDGEAGAKQLTLEES